MKYPISYLKLVVSTVLYLSSVFKLVLLIADRGVLKSQIIIVDLLISPFSLTIFLLYCLFSFLYKQTISACCLECLDHL